MFVFRVTWFLFVVYIDTRGKGACVRLVDRLYKNLSPYRTDMKYAGPGKPHTNSCFYINENIRIEVNSGVSFLMVPHMCSMFTTSVDQQQHTSIKNVEY